MSPRRSRVEISALFPLTFMRFVLIYLYKSDCGKSGAALCMNLSSLCDSSFFRFQSFSLCASPWFSYTIIYRRFLRRISADVFRVLSLHFCRFVPFSVQARKILSRLRSLPKMMRSPVCRDENSHRFCAENAIYLLYHNTAKITIKTPRLDDGCRPNRPPPPDFSLCKLSISRQKISCAENCRKRPQNGTLSHKTACF